METSQEDLDAKNGDLKTAVEEGDAGNPNAVRSEAKNIPKTEGAVDKLESNLGMVKGRAKTLIERTDRLKDDMKKAEKKVS